MHILKTREKLSKAHPNQCFLKRDQEWSGWGAQGSSGTILRITMCNKGVQFVALRCTHKGCEDRGKWLRTMIKIKVHVPHLQVRNQVPRCYRMRFSYHARHLFRPHFTRQDLSITKCFLSQKVLFLKVTQSLLMSFMTDLLYYEKRKK